MLSEIAPLLPSDHNLLARLNSENKPHEPIGAEMELGLLWGISRVADIEIEPTRFTVSRKPEAYSPDFFRALLRF